MKRQDIAIQLVQLTESLDAELVDVCGCHAGELLEAGFIGMHGYYLSHGSVFVNGSYAVEQVGSLTVGKLRRNSNGEAIKLIDAMLHVIGNIRNQIDKQRDRSTSLENEGRQMLQSITSG